MRSQLDFQQELRDKQYEYDKFNRAKEWDLKKMELHSQLDFEQEEKERLRKKATFNAGIESIDKNEGLTGEQRNDAKFNLASKYTDIPEAAQYLGLKSQTERQSSVEQQKWDLLTPEQKQQLAEKPLTPKAEKPTFTPYNIQKGLGVLSTGAPESAFGIPLPVLESKKDHEQWAEKNWGPSWKTLVPEAVDLLNDKFGTNDLKPLSVDVAKQFLLAAGGNMEEAKKLARQAGYEAK